MGKTVTVTCDGCGADITTTKNSVDYRLVLGSETKPGYGPGLYTDVAIRPPVDRTYYFCSINCLDVWRSRNRVENISPPYVEWSDIYPTHWTPAPEQPDEEE